MLAELANLSEAIKKINIKYVMRYNRSGDRIGHVFQDRYRSEVISDDSHLLQVMRCVHNNPMKAGLVSDPEAYFWSSYREYLDASPHVTKQAIFEMVMSLFSGNIGSFKAFHQINDLAEFLDTHEDIEQNRAQTAQAVIESFCMATGVADAKEIYRNAERLEESVVELLQRSRLSHRQIAGLLEISSSFVHRASLVQKTPG